MTPVEFVLQSVFGAFLQGVGLLLAFAAYQKANKSSK